VIATAGKSSIEGQTIPEAGQRTCILDVSEMDQILELHEKDMQVTVQPGVGWIELKDYLEPKGIRRSGLSEQAMIGGMYGTMSQNVVSLRVVLANGTVITTRKRPAKSSAGYDLTRLFVGSEGTLGIISQATLRLRRIPTYTAIVMTQFRSSSEAADAAVSVVNSSMQMERIEFMDSHAIKSVNHVYDTSHAPNPTVLFECAAGSMLHLSELVSALKTITNRHGCLMFQQESDAQGRKLWQVRKNAFFASKALRPD
ncbi:hypothetical protein HDU91_004179, partial [Kappamyces sp. JEL0680]